MVPDSWLLTLMTFVPAAGTVVVLALPRGRDALVRWVALAFAAVPLLLSFQLLARFDGSAPALRQLVASPAQGYQFLAEADWIPAFGIKYLMGVDGISVPMVFLTALLSFLCIPASWGIQQAVKGYFALFLLLETGMMGVFCSLDFFLFYVFWEVMLLPMYFLIGIWGGPRREYAAIKFFLYTLLGSVLMLLVMLAMYFAVEPHTFDLRVLTAAGQAGTVFRGTFWTACFIGLFIAFAIKVPVFPFHTWLPDAHVEAPTAVSVILAGVLLKMGTYGLLRISFPILPEATAWFAPFLAVLGLVNIVYGALCSMAQKDLKKMVAYSSVSHMGFCLLGMASATPEGIAGCVLQMFNHGTITGMLFLLVGIIYDRAHHRDIDGFGGIWKPMPVYGGLTAFAFFASLGLPGLSGFVGEVLVFLGAFQVEAIRWITVVSVSGVVLGAGYFLWAYQRMFLGPLNPKYAELPDASARERWTILPLAAITLAIGIYPNLYLDRTRAAIDRLALEQMEQVWPKTAPPASK
jgi:NADH-quinone oxidoreductase subunit M